MYFFFFSKHAKRHPFFEPEIVRHSWAGEGGALVLPQGSSKLETPTKDDRGSYSTGVHTDTSDGMPSP